MLSGHKLLILVGYCINFYGSGNCLIFSSCEQVKCEIENNGIFRLCTINTDPGAWLSEAMPIGETHAMACEVGKTYGKVGGKLWVTESCHGQFRVCGSKMSRYGVGKCFTPFECNGEVTEICDAGPKGSTFITVAELREKPESSHCNSETFSRNGNSLYVDKTCNGVYTICYANQYDVIFTSKRCEGSCKIDHAGMIVLLEINHVYHGKEECKHVKLESGASSYVHMSGCDADVTVGYIPVKYEITCTSKDNKNTTCTDNRSIPASVSLQRELSEGRCFLGLTYGFNTDENETPEVWVAGGCDAEFAAFPRVYEGHLQG